MHILVTGGGGFLGQHIVSQLQQRGHTVRILARSAYPALAAQGVDCQQGNLADADAVHASCAGIDAVFHVAAKAGIWGSRAAFQQANVTGTENIIAACRAHGIRYLVHTSTPSVVYNGQPLANADESLPLTQDCPCHYPTSKAVAERLVLAANSESLRTVALRPHLIWGAGDTHLVPRVVAQARAGRLRIIGEGKNRVDLTHVANAAHAHLLALDNLLADGPASGRAYFLSDNAPVALWEWINSLLRALDIPPVTRRISLRSARSLGAFAEALWATFPLRGEPPMTRFVAVELAKDHWFNIEAAQRDLGYHPVVSPQDGLEELLASLRMAQR